MILAIKIYDSIAVWGTKRHRKYLIDLVKCLFRILDVKNYCKVSLKVDLELTVLLWFLIVNLECTSNIQ